MVDPQRIPNGSAKFGVLFAISVAVLFFQCFPRALRIFKTWLEPWRWKWEVQLLITIGILLILIALRFGPGLYEEWAARRKRILLEKLKSSQLKKVREERELYDRLKRARERRVY